MIYKDLNKLVRMIGVFKMDQGRWPRSAQELAGVVEDKGWTVDVSSFRMLVFDPLSPQRMAIEMAWPAPGNGLSCLRVELVESGVEGQDHPYLVEYPKPEEESPKAFFCFIEKIPMVQLKLA